MNAVIFYHANSKLEDTAYDLSTLLKIKINTKYKSLIFDVDFFMKLRRNPDGLEFGRFNFEFPGGCFEFNNSIEFSYDDNSKDDKIIDMVSKILYFFWSKDIPAVASGIEGGKLPYNGGYNRKDLPWPKNDSNNFF
ncbi:hypothetical protein [Tenacibaculum sp. 190524A05c]|uniref:hypothetical protein n=1 Tax=Tenacibaculum platacis TaxID=3137852 RepID=UPI0032B19433